MNINKTNNQSGAALVEFTLVLPLLLLFLFGIIEFSILLYDQAVITNASREAARAWTVYRDNTNTVKLSLADVKQIVTDYSQNRLISFGGKGLSVTTDPTLLSGPIPFAKGDYLKVTVNYEYDFLLLPSLAQNLLPAINLRAETSMRAE